MVGRADCPPWCVAHAEGTGEGEHRVVVGDVMLTLSGDSRSRRAICAVRRRAARTPAEMTRLVEDLTAAGLLLRRAARRGLTDARRSLAAAQLSPT